MQSGVVDAVNVKQHDDVGTLELRLTRSRFDSLVWLVNIVFSQS